MRQLAVLIPLVLVTTSPSVAGPPERLDEPAIGSKGARKSVTARWVEELGTIDGLILGGEPGKALKRADKLATDIADRVVSSADAPPLLGPVQLLRALAAHDAGMAEDALWHWHVGLQLFPAIAEQNLDLYGEAGTFLLANPLPEPEKPREGVTRRRVPPPENMTFPKKIHGPRAKLPRTKDLEKKNFNVVVKAMIDVTGRPTQPRIVEANGELTTVFVNLDTLRTWRFEPATMDGEPIPMNYKLTMDYDFRSSRRIR